MSQLPKISMVNLLENRSKRGKPQEAPGKQLGRQVIFIWVIKCENGFLE